MSLNSHFGSSPPSATVAVGRKRDFFNQSKSRFIVFGVTSITAGKRKRKIERRRKKKKSISRASVEGIEDVINGIESDEDLGDQGVSVVWVCFFNTARTVSTWQKKKKCETNLKKYVT
ncbi:hypothetical protein CEXT_280731 [Caerostris extrusa]|uniref:Uncharacterized protein n=1 Tax=Caerostris extrusa TaxID=172846 RepID=A0AAV4P348_CAEEX|nr:hypothetical protein CEXT_280731 [Caerostris extrusa]